MGEIPWLGAMSFLRQSIIFCTSSFEMDRPVGRAIDGQLKDIEAVIAADDVVILLRFDTCREVYIGVE